MRSKWNYGFTTARAALPTASGISLITLIILSALLSISCVKYARQEASDYKGEAYAGRESATISQSMPYPGESPPPASTGADYGGGAGEYAKTASDDSGAHRVSDASLDWMASEQSAAEIEAMMVYTAELAVTVEDAPKAAEDAKELAKKRGGYITQMSQTGKDDKLVITIQAKIPSVKLFDFLKEVKAFGEVEYENVVGEDVSDEYFDLSARKASLELSLERLTDLLAKSGKLTDLLTIEQEVTRTQESLNQATGRMKKLEHLNAFSTVNITLSLEPRPDVYEPPKFSWLTNKTLGTAWTSFIVFVRGLWTIALWIAVWSPLIAVIAAIALSIRAVRRRRRKARQA